MLTNDKVSTEPANTKLEYYSSSLRIRNARLSHEWTKNVAIYGFSSGKFPYVRK